MTTDEQGHVQTRQEVHGVDFSGAKDAGKKIWIASGQIKGRTLQIICCRPAKDLPHSGRDLKAALKALRHFIAEQRSSAIGIDFPFGLPQSLVKETSWEAFVAAMRCYSSPEEFKKKCFERAGRVELKRQTDVDAKTPFSPYNLRLYKQTYFGIRDVLAPLLEGRQICALPMQSPVDDRPWVMEICPASTLSLRLGCSCPYKKRTEQSREARKSILGKLKSRGVTIIDEHLWSKIVADSGGNALDSVIAAFAVFQNLTNCPINWRVGAAIAKEGHVYV